MLEDIKVSFGNLSEGAAGLTLTSLFFGAIVADLFSMRLSTKSAPPQCTVR